MITRKLGIGVVVAVGVLTASPALAWDCPQPDKQATAQQIFDARIAALQVGDLNTIACSYAEDAVVIFPGSVVTGRDAIMDAFIAFASTFGGAAPTITSTTMADNVLLVTYTLSTPNASIPDGSDTFIVRKGRIEYQVVHASIVFPQP